MSLTHYSAASTLGRMQSIALESRAANQPRLREPQSEHDAPRHAKPASDPAGHWRNFSDDRDRDGPTGDRLAARPNHPAQRAAAAPASACARRDPRELLAALSPQPAQRRVAGHLGPSPRRPAHRPLDAGPTAIRP